MAASASRSRLDPGLSLAVTIGVGAALLGLELRFPQDQLVGNSLIIGGLALAIVPIVWVIVGERLWRSWRRRAGFPSGSVEPPATPRITEGVFERVGGDPGYPPKRLSERAGLDDDSSERTGTVNLHETYECPQCGAVEVGLERFQRHRRWPHRRLRYGDGPGAGKLTFKDGRRERTVRWGADFWTVQETANGLLESEPDVRLVAPIAPTNTTARRLEAALETRLGNEGPRLRYRDTHGSGTLTFPDASGTRQTVTAGEEFTTDMVTAATLLRTDPDVHAIEPTPPGRLVLALWEEGADVRTAVARSKRVHLGPDDAPKRPLDDDQKAAEAHYRDWLDRCERLITDKWYRYVPAFQLALKAPQREPEVREQHNIFDRRW